MRWEGSLMTRFVVQVYVSEKPRRLSVAKILGKKVIWTCRSDGMIVIMLGWPNVECISREI